MWAITALVTMGSCTSLLVGVLEAKGAPQEAAAGAVVSAVVIIFYVLTRCCEGLERRGEKTDKRIQETNKNSGEGGILGQ